MGRRFPDQAANRGRGDRLALTERDALVIAYGNHVLEPGAAPLRTLNKLLDQHVSGLISGVHVLPFFPSSSDDGFSVIDYRRVEPSLGSWDDVSALGADFQLMFDGVFNHVSAESDWFRRFLVDDPEYREWFINVEGNPDLSQVVRPRTLPLLTTFETASGPKHVWTTFSPDQIDLNVKNPEALLALFDILLFYVERGARFIRLDAIAYLWKEIGTSCVHLPQTHRVVQLMRTVLDEVAPDVMLITETNVPHPDNISYFGDGTDEAQLVYNFALPPLVLHSLVSGSAEALTRWARTLKLPTTQVTFLNFLASHDGIGVTPVRGILSDTEVDQLVQLAQARGGFVSRRSKQDGTTTPYELNINYFDALFAGSGAESEQVAIDRFLTAHAIMLAMPGLPAIYLHSLFGSRGDRAGAELSRMPRRINRKRLVLAELERDLDDRGSRPSRVLKGVTELLRQRQECPAFQPTAAAEVLDLDPRVFAIRRTSTDGSKDAVCLHNVSSEALQVYDQALGPYQTRWLL
jgi:glycosidase